MKSVKYTIFLFFKVLINFVAAADDINVSDRPIKGGVIKCTVKGEICPINKICEYSCRYTCLNTSDSLQPVYGVGVYSADSSLCKAALHDLRISKWSRSIKVESFQKDDCFFQHSIRFGISSYSLHQKSCRAFKFINAKVAEVLLDVVSVHSNYLHDKNDTHTQDCIISTNALDQNVNFYTYWNWTQTDKGKRNTNLYNNYIRHTKKWSSATGGSGFQCVPEDTTLSVITSIAFRKDADFLPKIITVVANTNESIVLSMYKQGNKTTEMKTVWRKDGMILPQPAGDISKIPLININESHSGIYSFGYENSAVNHKEAFVQLIVRSCPKEKYGMNCSFSCPLCLNGGICHDITGECICAPGFNGSRCDKACKPGYLGKTCNIKCPGKGNNDAEWCKGLLICLPSPYGCSCASGFKGLYCNKACKDAFYGVGCLLKHKYLHYKKESCSTVSGSCDCLSGWHGAYCNISYPVLSHAPLLVNVSESSLTISFNEWSNDTDLGSGTPVSYEVIIRENENSDWQNESIISAGVGNQTYFITFHNLNPGYSYNIAVVVNDKTGGRQESDIKILNASTLCDAPSLPPTDIEMDVIEQNVSVIWKLPPKTSWNCWELETVIRLRESFGNLTEEYKVNDTIYFFYSEPYLTWIVEVCILPVDGELADMVCSNPENITADGSMYYEPIDLEVIKQKTSLFVSWIPPVKYSGKMNYYIISYTDMKTNNTDFGILQLKDATCQGEKIYYYHCWAIHNLVPGHLYKVEIIAVVNTEESLIKSFTVQIQGEDVGITYHSASADTLGIALPVVLAVVLFILLLYIYKRKKIVSSLKIKFLPSYKIENDFAACNEALDEMDIIETESLCEEVSNQIFIKDLPEYVKENVQNNKIRREFLSIPNGQIYPCSIAKLGENKPKNRYGNILPYDHSRVILDTIKDDPFSNYIHASYVNGYQKGKKYIATQGPLWNTINDFWRMVWNKNSCKILMITNFVENGKAKCEKYWPDTTACYGDVTVCNEESQSYANFVVRTFKITKGKHSREIKQFHFVSWPDHGAPPSTPPFVTFLKKTRLYKPNDEAPIIIHCSAGIGRTGTTIMLDSMIDMGLHEKCVDIVKQLFSMRKERMNILENLDQYMFVHYALIECLCFEECCIIASDFKAEYERLQVIDNATGLTKIEKLYQDLNELPFQLMYKDIQEAYMLVNQNKNRSMYILPPDKARPFLSDESLGSGYINAVYVESFSVKNAYIATQYPLPDTVEDFWSMVYESKSRTVVLLQGTEFTDKDSSPQLWSSGLKRCGSFNIQFCSCTSEDELSVTVLQLSVVDKEIEDTLPVLFITVQNWPCSQNLPSSPKTMLSILSKIHFLQEESKHVITSVCLDGVTACGILCAMLYICDQIEREQTIDVLHAVKCIKANRPQFILDLDQYKFLYEVTNLYLQS